MYPDQVALSEPEGASTREASLDRVGSSDQADFDQLFERYNSMVFSLAYQVLGDREEALDVAQDVFFTIYRKMGTFRGESTLKTWIYSIAIHRATNRYRWWNRLRRRGTVSLEEHLSRKPGQDHSMSLESGIRSPLQALILDEERLQITRCLQQVPPPQRIAVILRDIEGLTYEEIAQSTNVSLGTVKSRIARGREMLKRLVAENQTEAGGRHVL